MDTLAASGRYATLDIVRGVAVLGILLMNVVAFAMPDAAYTNPLAWGGRASIDMAVWAIEFVFVDAKMRGLFSLLFGASLLLVAERAEARGASAWRVHYARMAWLFVFGVAHLVLVWWGDILAHYALIGGIAFAFRKREAHELVIAAALLILVQAWLLAGIPIAADAATVAVAGGHPSAAMLADFQGFRGEFGMPSAHALATDLALHRGGYAALVAMRWQAVGGLLIGTLWTTGLETLGFMLIGMAALRGDLLTGAWERGRYRRWAIVAFAVGAPLFALLAAIIATHGFSMSVVAWCAIVLPVPVRPVMILGWACLIVGVARPGVGIWSRLEAAGRMAFSNYIATSLICTTLFYGYGGGLYGHVSRARSLLVVAAVWLAILLWSRPWLARFRHGPLEWLWRSLARRRWQPMQRRSVI